MVPVMSLWLPIVLGAVFAFVASFVIHMLLTYHRSDVAPVPGENGIREAFRKAAVPPGDYVIPHAGSPAAMKSPEFVSKMTEGPVVYLTVMPSGPPAMGKNLVQWFIYCVVVSLFAAYLTGRALPAGAPYLSVFRFAGATAFAGYGLAQLQSSIWWGRKWSSTIKGLFDSLVYALLTAGAFGWLWPS